MKKSSKKSTKKITKRSTKKYAGLDTNVNRKNLKEFIDFDYVKDLSEKEKDFLDRFSKEYYSADFRDGRNIFKTKKEQRAIGRENNRRNKDTYAFKRSVGMLKEIREDHSSASPENALNEALDLRLKKRNNLKNR